MPGGDRKGEEALTRLRNGEPKLGDPTYRQGVISGEATCVLDVRNLQFSKAKLFLQPLGGGGRRTAEAKDRFGERPDHRIHGCVLPVERPTVWNEVHPDEWVMIQDYRGSMPPMKLGAGVDLIEVEGTDGAKSPDARHPMKMSVGDHHEGQCGPSAIEVSGCRDIRASTSGQGLLVLR
jgi:hypothetical protein